MIIQRDPWTPGSTYWLTCTGPDSNHLYDVSLRTVNGYATTEIDGKFQGDVYSITQFPPESSVMWNSPPLPFVATGWTNLDVTFSAKFHHGDLVHAVMNGEITQMIVG